MRERESQREKDGVERERKERGREKHTALMMISPSSYSRDQSTGGRLT